ncbi:recombinase family protein [Hyphomicrobium sp. NDB2Meth4]|uniref:recombinase family protein n=1 Tax=Hyphomicrobium sp. NDB2Meth4 TaxID=1892846 RepID=UPI0009303237|nr:recombinase family protein [Hyphomicrobium sp. NDB2Meth4]
MTKTTALNASPAQAVIYCRVSSQRQMKEGDGLASQETRCREYARHRGYEVVQVFRDEGVSGGMIDRPAVQLLLGFLRKHRTHARHIVIIDDISRLARDVVAHRQLRDSIDDAGGKLESPSIEFGEDSDSILVENLLASVSQHQRQKNAEQVVNRMRARVMSGYWVFANPVGYRYERKPGHGKILVPDEPTASIVREVLEGFATGRFASQMEIKRFLEGKPGFTSRHGKTVHLQKIREMLERPTYAGYIDAPQWGIAPLLGKHEPLITYETHLRVLERLKGRPVGALRKDTREDFPLRGIVACACCGHTMSAGWSKGRNGQYPYYFCQAKGCEESRKSIRKERIEGDFETLLDAIRPDAPLIDAFHELVSEVWAAGRKGQAEQHQTLKAELTEIERKSSQLMERLIAADNGVLIAAYEAEVRKLQERRIVLQERLASRGEEVIDFNLGYRTALSFIANPRKMWASDHLPSRRLVPKLLFGRGLHYNRKEGYRTGEIAYPFKALQAIRTGKYGLVEGAGFEPA